MLQVHPSLPPPPALREPRPKSEGDCYQPAKSRLRFDPQRPNSGSAASGAGHRSCAAPSPSLFPVTSPRQAAAITESRALVPERAEEEAQRPTAEYCSESQRASASLSSRQKNTRNRRRRVRVPRVRAAAREQRGATAGWGGWHHGREGVHQGAGPVDRAAERVQAAVRVPGQEPMREGELYSGSRQLPWGRPRRRKGDREEGVTWRRPPARAPRVTETGAQPGRRLLPNDLAPPASRAGIGCRRQRRLKWRRSPGSWAFESPGLGARRSGWGGGAETLWVSIRDGFEGERA
ncbi:hypothetical protein P7K49_005258 [Saguinus oedipus]|uniref:Uncharacterized protein n=1 Tax=Saguinus oedipus TaxID=9490 RepID=A0ABQ9WAL3_SAGOE|nr:hypothetical protein P7K49_005258 [Saguinus oedipus]